MKALLHEPNHFKVVESDQNLCEKEGPNKDEDWVRKDKRARTFIFLNIEDTQLNACHSSQNSKKSVGCSR